MKHKLLYSRLCLSLVFILIWIIDIIIPTFNPTYTPLLDYLKIMVSFLNLLGGVPDAV